MKKLNHVRCNTLPKQFKFYCFNCDQIIMENMMFGERNVSGCFVNVCERCF